MLTYNEAFYDLKKKLQLLYDERETEAIAHELIQHITGYNRTERLLHKGTHFTATQTDRYNLAVIDLLKGKPLQYVMGTAWFMGREYLVNESVLIPRPETEELVQWIINDWKKTDNQINIVDIGTGSGCIPISLKLAISTSNITTCDISADALNVAKENATRLQTIINLLQLDFLDVPLRNKLPTYDVIVSNPPYITFAEKERMHINVVDYEPGIALFVPDTDALVFYRAIVAFGKDHLNSNGYIYCELDAGHAEECKVMFEDNGYSNVEIRKDMHGNWRMLKAGK